MKYRYSVLSGQTNVERGYARRPLVEVVVSNGGHKRTFLALIDSGADQTMMPSAAAELFGITRDHAARRLTLRISMKTVEGLCRPPHLSDTVPG
jgi:hypothetical protein